MLQHIAQLAGSWQNGVPGASHESILEETPVANVLAMFDAVRKFGSYS
jgi:hypothetical protein